MFRPTTIFCALAAAVIIAAVSPAQEADMEMTVIATRSEEKTQDVPAAVDIVTEEEFRKEGGQNLGDVTRFMPNVDVPFDAATGDGLVPYLQSGFSSINIRGIEGNRILLTVDGIRQPESFTATSFDQSAEAPGGSGRDFFDPAIYQQIEVVKGASSSLYGSDALGGVVSFTSPDPMDLLEIAGGPQAARQTVSYFTSNNGVNSITTLAAEKGPAAALVKYSYREGNETINKGDIPPNPLWFSSHALLAKWNSFIGNDHFFEFTGEYFQRDVSSDVNSAENQPGLTDLQVFNDEFRQRYRFSVGYEYAPWDGGTLADLAAADVYFQKTYNRNFNLSRGSNPFTGGINRDRRQTIEYNTNIAGIGTQFDKEFFADNWGDHDLIYGTEFSRSHVENSFERRDVQPGGQAEDRIGFAPSSVYRAAVFAQDEITLGSDRDWVVTPGLRFDYYLVEPELSSDYLNRLAAIEATFGGGTRLEPAQTYENFAFAPKISVLKKVTPELNVWASYSHGIRNPSAEELSIVFVHGGANPFVQIPNPDLTEESSDSFEAGVKGDYDAISFEVNGFYTFYQDFIETFFDTGQTDASGNTIFTTVNLGDVDIYGFEASGELHLGALEPDLAGFHLGAKTGASIGYDKTNDARLNSIDPWETVFYARFAEPSEDRYGVRFTGVYQTSKTWIDDNQPGGPFFRPGDSLVFFATAYYNLSENFSINAGINNIFDTEYYEWSTVRRAGGHAGGAGITDRLTEPGRNFFISLTTTF